MSRKEAAMFSVNLLQKQFEAGRFEQILDSIVANGMALPLPLRIRLSQTPVSAVAMGLRRLAELTYGPTRLGKTLARYLLRAQHEDGSFDHDPLATAAAGAALSQLAQQRGGDEPEIIHARDRALAALALMQETDPDRPGFACDRDRTRGDRALTGSLILFLLGHDQRFRQAVRYGDLVGWYEDHEDRLDPDTRRLWHMAQLETAGHDDDGHHRHALVLAA
ncbi:MAG: hypothetical protein IT440_13110 [Phycisphaeraceae bacterium]|nr:hypothetical protein [Phycisphaeraceae bacterium]